MYLMTSLWGTGEVFLTQITLEITITYKTKGKGNVCKCCTLADKDPHPQHTQGYI